MRRSRMKCGKVINNDLDSIGKVMMVAIEDDGKLIVNDRQGFFHLLS
jgi:frataxin-like iron-binding protein CyaY